MMPSVTRSIQIEKVRVHQFRSLKDVEISLSERTLLIGANNAGKTSFLRAMALALGEGRKFLSRDDLFIDGQGNTPIDAKLWVDVMIKPVNGDDFPDEWAQVIGDNIQISADGASFFAFRTLLDFSSDQSQAIIRRYVITDWVSGLADENQTVTANLSKFPLFFIDAQRDLEADLRYAQSYFGRLAAQIEYDPAQKKELEDALTALNQQAVDNSPVLAHLKTTLEELNRTVNNSQRGQGVEIAPFPKKLRDLHKGLKVNFQDGGSDTFSLEYHGMGTRSWASLLGYKAFVNWMWKKAYDDQDVLHPLLALEEPEAHLHPNAQRQVYSQLKDVAGQKIISTHSPYIAPLGRLEELRIFYKEGDETKVRDLSGLVVSMEQGARTRLEEEIIRYRGEILFARLVVLFEGQTEERALPIFAKFYWGCEAFEKGISMVHCAGGDFKLYTQLLEALQLRWVILSDYDNPTIQSKVQSAGQVVGVNDVNADVSSRFFCLGESIEKHLLNEGYREQFEEAIHTFNEPIYQNERHQQAKQAERAQERAQLNAISIQDLERKIDSLKAKIAPLWATAIIDHSNPAKRIPAKIKALFEAIDTRIS